MIKVVKFRKSHIPTIVKIEKETFSENAWSKRLFEGELKREDAFYFTMFDDKEIAGYAGLHILDGEAELVNIAVKAEYRGKGLGRGLLNEAVEFSKRRGAERLFLEVDTENAAAINLYQSAGFKTIFTRKRYYPNGHDAHVMEKSLNA
ncbi:MAG: ribosomal protein S18-alanine N-acetyltransferase [Christensenellales bacterium]|jgi:ribosomal-protein-alanine N-acetyltransferase